MIKKLLEDELPREKLIKNGSEHLSDVELMAILLRTGTKNKNVIDLSREILKNFNPNILSRKSVEELMQIEGIKTAKACQIVAVYELSRRLSSRLRFEDNKSTEIKSSKDIYELVCEDFSDLPTERVMAVYVNTKNKVIKKEFLFEGGFDYSVIDIKTLIKKTLNNNSTGVFILHNHPSGDPTPSENDIEVTKKIVEVFKNLELRFLDHIVIGNRYFSFFDNDLI